ncbi:MAG: FAD-binding oxidoreductase [Actinobacteria bacterium]|nr:FAD-binding oxidoreductase [Actinomycetota bacterium]
MTDQADAVTTPPRFRGEILTPGDAGYDEARSVFNRRLIGRPAAIARCAGVADVRAALRLAREQGLEIAVRCGGHSVGGWSSVEGGLVIDLTLMRGIRVDPASATAWVGGGTRAIDIILEAAEFGLAPVTGVTAKVGLGGLLLGLGEGYLTPRHGFGVDNVLELELVTADGEVLQASAEQNPDLFWALRGAGPNFGVVTAMRLRLHPAPQQGIGGFVTFGHDDVRAVSRHLWEVMEHGSADYFPLAKYDLDEKGQMRVAVIPGHVGGADLAEREVGALRSCATPVNDETRPMSYVELIEEIDGGGASDDDPAAPRRQAWELKQFAFDGDAERQIEAMIEQTEGLAGPAPRPFISLWRSVAPEPPPGTAGAAPRRHGTALFVASYWSDPADDEEQVRLVDEITAAFVDAGVVTEAIDAINHVGVLDRDQERVRRVYGEEAYQRLAGLKAVYDPKNLFHRNCNVEPSR